MHLTPCAECHRHVAITETACPFCGGVIEMPRTPRASRLGRVSRAVVFASAAAAVAGAGCGKKGKQPDGKGSQQVAPADAAVDPPPPPPDDKNNVPMPYGAPPARKRYV